jgi:hypothetical protein
MQDEVLMSKMEAAEFGSNVLLLANLLHDRESPSAWHVIVPIPHTPKD